MKVHELAKELNIPSKEVIARAKKNNIELASHMSTLNPLDAKIIKEEVEGEKAEIPEDKVPMPKPRNRIARITKEELEKEETKLNESKIDEDDKEKASFEPKVKEKKEKPKLKVAHQDKSELIPPKSKSVETVKKAESAPEKPDLKDEKDNVKKGIDLKEDDKPKKVDKAEQKLEIKSEKKTVKDLQPEKKEAAAKKTKVAATKDIKNSDKSESSKKKPLDQATEKSKDTKPKEDKKKSFTKKDKKKDKKTDSYSKDRKDKKTGKKGGRHEHVSLEKKSNRPKARPKPKVVEVEEPKINLEELEAGTRIINVPITVAGFAEQVGKTPSDVIMTLMKLGIMANINQNIDEDTVLILGEELNVPVVIQDDAGEVVEEGFEDFEDKEEDLVKRAPIITVMGHVDHGKTSLLDAIRETNVTKGEAGGITQHIGASEVKINGEKIVFLDTPGHEAFTAMRARGAHVTDIAVLVVAADDSVKPQTIESISHAKAAGVPIIVAINKIDKPAANPDKVKQDLADKGILVEDWGGDTISVPVSAKTGEGITSLLEMILLQAEVLELKANPNRLAQGTVLEARLDKAKGPVTSLLVLNGSLDTSSSVVAGTTSGRIRAMVDHLGKPIKKAGPATAVEILGLTDVPEAGDEFRAVKDDRLAREIADNRKSKLREERMTQNQAGVSLESLFGSIQDGSVKDLNLIIKGDVQGSVGALTTSLEKLKNDNINLKIVHGGVGTVTESDVSLASASGSIIIGFNIRPSVSIQKHAEEKEVEIRTYRVIYDAINDIESAMLGMLDPEFKEVILGTVEIRETFKVPNVGTIGGAYVTSGKIQRKAGVRLVRDGIVIHEGNISSLKRFKDDVREVSQGYECGVGIENYNDLKIGDVIEAFTMEEIKR